MDAVAVIDCSAVAGAHRSALQSARQALAELIEDTADVIERMALVLFSNTATIASGWVDAHRLDLSLLRAEGGGMCNANLALAKCAALLEKSTADTRIVIMVLTSDPTDRARFDNKTRHVLSEAEKFTIKRNLQILEPDGLQGSREYLLGDPSGLERLKDDIRDLKQPLQDDNAGGDAVLTDAGDAPRLPEIGDFN